MEVEAEDLHEAVEKVSDDPMNYILFEEIGQRWTVVENMDGYFFFTLHALTR